MSDAARRRLEAVERIAALRQQMKRIEEIKLARLTAEEAALEETRAVVIATLNDDTRLHGLFVDAMAARLRRVDERQSALQPLKAAQRSQVLTQARLAKYAETMITRLARQVAATAEKRALEGLTEQFLARAAHASLPQACPANLPPAAPGSAGAARATDDGAAVRSADLDSAPAPARGPSFGVR